jgi:hypothetical protein
VVFIFCPDGLDGDESFSSLEHAAIKIIIANSTVSPERKFELNIE